MASGCSRTGHVPSNNAMNPPDSASLRPRVIAGVSVLGQKNESIGGNGCHCLERRMSRCISERPPRCPKT